MTIHRDLLAPCVTSEALKRQGTNGGSSTSSTMDVSSLKRSLSSLLSTHSYTTTPEYSPQLITSEVGKLLSVTDLDIGNGTENAHFQYPHTRHSGHGRVTSRTKFDLASTTDDATSDTDTDEDEGEYTVDAAASQPPLRKVNTSTHCCGGGGPLENFSDPVWDFGTKWAIVLIGLPASGKSSVIRHLMDFVKTQTESRVRCKSFNAGDVRRRYEMDMDKFDFNFSNEESLARRDFYAFEALSDLTTSLVEDTIDVGIFDATNTTVERRKRVFDKIKEASQRSGVIIHPILFEVKCQNRALRRYNIEQKSQNSDYRDMPKEAAIVDFLDRIRKYELIYEGVSVEEIVGLGVKYFGITNVGDAIYYDCGVQHHDSKRHLDLEFKYLMLNILYAFLQCYREEYAEEYLEKVRVFYDEGHYKPVNTPFSTPVTAVDTAFPVNPTTIPKVLSSSRLKN